MSVCTLPEGGISDIKPEQSEYEYLVDVANNIHHIESLGITTPANASLPQGTHASRRPNHNLVQSVISDGNKGCISRARSWNDTTPHDKHARLARSGSQEPLSLKRRCSLHLPSFKSLGISTSESGHWETRTKSLSPQRSTTSAASLAAALCGTASPLTPPPEDTTISNTDPLTHEMPSEHSIRATSHTVETQGPLQTSTLMIENLQAMAPPASSNTTSLSQLQRLPWIAEASYKMLTALNSVVSRDAMHVTSQTMPSQARDGRSRPTFEEILEILQGGLDTAPYITITHAVPQARIMEELPKTPPSTPNFRREPSDYFGNDQTIFTHAAVVPIYHCHSRTESSVAARLAHHIAAPGSVQVAVLERYIPPTMQQEIDDFFSVSGQSYLADRLSELSSSNGSLLLVYPTRAGGNTFARKYIGPIIDPYLRQFTMIKGLTTDAAAMMGNMSAVDSMIDLEEMQRRLSTLCQNLSARSRGRQPPTAFSLVHSETANIVLDRRTWFNWYIEQEQSRLRQNLVEYHQAGGRMPEAMGVREVTVGMVLREFVDGLRKVREPAGNAEIEVGVFLITRSTL